MEFKAKLEGRFLQQLKDRTAHWNKVPNRIAFKIVVPPELNWWYVQEFGVPHGYTITPRIAKKIAYFSDKWGQVVTDSVEHPGLRARHMVGSVNDEIVRDANNVVKEFLKQGLKADPQELRRKLLEEWGVRAKNTITKSFERNLPSEPPRPAADPRFVSTQSGKLKGLKAAKVYAALAKVLDVSR